MQRRQDSVSCLSFPGLNFGPLARHPPRSVQAQVVNSLGVQVAIVIFSDGPWYAAGCVLHASCFVLDHRSFGLCEKGIVGISQNVPPTFLVRCNHITLAW